MKPEKVWGGKIRDIQITVLVRTTMLACPPPPPPPGLPATRSPMYTDPLHNYDANSNDICFVRR